VDAVGEETGTYRFRAPSTTVASASEPTGCVGCPHSVQNRFPATIVAPHLEQITNPPSSASFSSGF